MLSARTHLLGGGIVVRAEFAYCLIFLDKGRTSGVKIKMAVFLNGLKLLL